MKYINRKGDVAELDDAFFAKARRGRPSLRPEQSKQQVSIMLDLDVVERLRTIGDISAQVNEALRKELGLPK